MALQFSTLTLTKSPFESLATSLILHLSMRVVFLISITSSGWVGKLENPTAAPPHGIKTRSFYDYMQIHPSVVLKFHINQIVYLPVFFLKPCASSEATSFLDMRLALAFYLQRTKPIRKSLKFVCHRRTSPKTSCFLPEDLHIDMWLYPTLSAGTLSYLTWCTGSLYKSEGSSGSITSRSN